MIVLLVLGYSVLETTYYVGLGIKAGIEKVLTLRLMQRLKRRDQQCASSATGTEFGGRYLD